MRASHLIIWRRVLKAFAAIMLSTPLLFVPMTWAQQQVVLCVGATLCVYAMRRVWREAACVAALAVGLAVFSPFAALLGIVLLPVVAAGAIVKNTSTKEEKP